MPAQQSIATGTVLGAAQRALTVQIVPSAFDKELVRLAGRYGLVHWLDPLAQIGGKVYDRASPGTIWMPPARGMVPAAATIAGQPAWSMSSLVDRTIYDGTTIAVPSGQSWVSNTGKRPGSFSILSVYEVSASDLAVATLRALFGSGPLASSTTLAYYSAGLGTTFRWGSDNTSSQDRVNMVRGAGVHVLCFSFDATTGIAQVHDKTSQIGTDTWTATVPPSGFPWQAGGTRPYTFQGKMARQLFYDRALGRADNATQRNETMALLAAQYGA